MLLFVEWELYECVGDDLFGLLCLFIEYYCLCEDVWIEGVLWVMGSLLLGVNVLLLLVFGVCG